MSKDIIVYKKFNSHTICRYNTMEDPPMFLVVKQKLYMDLQIQRSITLKNSLVLIFSPVNLFNFAHDDEHFYIFF